MGAREDIARLLKAAAASMKTDAKGAVTQGLSTRPKLREAFTREGTRGASRCRHRDD